MSKSMMVLLIAVLPARVFAAYAVDLPVVTHVQGATTTFFTSLDITNHTSASTAVSFEYVSSDLSVDVSGAFPSLGPHANFHTDDVLTYLATNNFITAAQGASGFGTLLIGFSNPTFTTGAEASATARIYNYLNSGQRPSVGLAYRAVPITLNGSHTVSTVIQDTSATASGASVVTNLGLENVGINDAGQVDPNPVTIQLTFYDPASGAQIGPQPTFTLKGAQVTQINSVWATYGLPANLNNIVVVATETSGTAQIRGYVSLKDTGTNDGSFFFMQ